MARVASGKEALWRVSHQVRRLYGASGKEALWRVLHQVRRLYGACQMLGLGEGHVTL